MTLQYNYNPPELWAGLEFYGNLFAYLLLYSLILTALLSAIGTVIVTISRKIVPIFNSSRDDWQA